MGAFQQRLRYLFGSTRGLALVAITMIALVTAVWGTLSGPMAEWGVREITIRLTGMKLVEAEREGRIITLYHSIALAVVAIEVYFITGIMRMRKGEAAAINATVTTGYLATMIGGLAFGYFGRNWIFHGLFIFGQSLVFFAGALLAAALWPWRKEAWNSSPEYARGPGGVDLERAAFFVMAIATLGSALFGAAAGASFGNGFEAFLAEDLIREPHKTLLQKSIIGHLHIMLTLIAVGITLITGRWLDFKGPLHKIAMPLMIAGTIIISLGAWSVVLVPWAHTIIYVGSVFVMLAALMLVIFGWRKLIRLGLEKENMPPGGFFQKLRALVHDPLAFGALWQMVFMNFTVSGVGIFMAVKLDEIFRVWPHREERIVLTGHWHILSGIIATIILFYYADLVGVKGKARQIFGWVVILFSDLAFLAVTVFEMKRLFVSEGAQQPLVDGLMILADLGLAGVLVALAGFLIWRLADFLSQNGGWRKPGAPEPGLPSAGLLLIIFLAPLCASCSPVSKIEDVPSYQTGVDPESWAAVPAGEFLSGQFNHPQELDYDFEIMVTGVTNRQYARYLNDALAAGKITRGEEAITGFYPGDPFNGYEHEEEVAAGMYLHLPLGRPELNLVEAAGRFEPRPGFEDHPAVMVTWFGALAYCEFYGWSLPGELEWEKAARGVDGRPFPWGETLLPQFAKYYASRDPFEAQAGKQGLTTPGGFYNGLTYGGYETADGASPYGAYDMAGNVWQWTADVYPDQHYRYLRGGSKADFPHNLRVWTRNSAGPSYFSPNTGFRCMRTTDEPDALSEQ